MVLISARATPANFSYFTSYALMDSLITLFLIVTILLIQMFSISIVHELFLNKVMHVQVSQSAQRSDMEMSDTTDAIFAPAINQNEPLEHQ